MNIYLIYIFIITNAYNPVHQTTMPRISTGMFLVAVATLQALLSPDIPFWVQLYFLNKKDHGDVDAYVDKNYRDAIHSHFGLDPTFVACPSGDNHRNQVTIVVDGHPVQMDFIYSCNPEATAFACSYGGFFHILFLHSLRGMYGQHVSIIDGHVVFTEGTVVVPIMTLEQFLVHHNFILSTFQEHAFLNFDALFDAWSKSTCFFPSAIVSAFQKSKKRDERVTEMYNAFTAWLSSKDLSVEKLLDEPVLTPEQCQQKAEEAFPEACQCFQQALDAEKEAMKRIESAKKMASVSSIIALITPDATDKTQMPLFASVSRFLQGTQNVGDRKCANCEKCIALHDQFKAMYGNGDIYTASATTAGTETWVNYVKEMWALYNGIPTTTQDT